MNSLRQISLWTGLTMPESHGNGEGKEMRFLKEKVAVPNGTNLSLPVFISMLNLPEDFSWTIQ